MWGNPFGGGYGGAYGGGYNQQPGATQFGAGGGYPFQQFYGAGGQQGTVHQGSQPPPQTIPSVTPQQQYHHHQQPHHQHVPQGAQTYHADRGMPMEHSQPTPPRQQPQQPPQPPPEPIPTVDDEMKEMEERCAVLEDEVQQLKNENHELKSTVHKLSSELSESKESLQKAKDELTKKEQQAEAMLRTRERTKAKRPTPKRAAPKAAESPIRGEPPPFTGVKDQERVRPSLGVAVREKADFVGGVKLHIYHVTPDGPADQEGIQRDEMIVKFGAVTVPTKRALLKHLNASHVGERLYLMIESVEGELREVTVTLVPPVTGGAHDMDSYA